MQDFKLASYASARGARAGIVANDRLYDAADAAQNPAYESLEAIVADWARASSALFSVSKTLNGGGQPVSDVQLLAPLRLPGTIYCAGANYQDHMDAVAKHRGLPPQPSPKAVGAGPFFFIKAGGCVVGPNATVENESEALDFEIELAVIIGREARKVPAADALDYVAGYTVANDLSARDRIMRPQMPDSSPFKYDWGSHKNFDGSCPLGPWIVPASMIPDPQALSLKTWVNDELRQNSTTGGMVFSVAELIEGASRFNTLYPGDIILTGTPAGVGAETSTWVHKGDVIRMEIGGIGSISTRIQ